MLPCTFLMWQSFPHFEHTRCKYWIMIVSVTIFTLFIYSFIINHYYYYWYHCYLSTTTSLIVAKISSGILASFDSSKVVINDFTLAWFFHRLVARGKIYFFTRWPSSLLWYRFLFLLAIYDLLNGLSSLYRVETTCHQDHPLNVVRHLARCSVGSLVDIGGWHSDLFLCKKSDYGHIIYAFMRIFSDDH